LSTNLVSRCSTTETDRQEQQEKSPAKSDPTALKLAKIRILSKVNIQNGVNSAENWLKLQTCHK
ncbi:MAG: hypothetical protein ACTHJK_02140, partial [Sphingomicrobium sp.]